VVDASLLMPHTRWVCPSTERAPARLSVAPEARDGHPREALAPTTRVQVRDRVLNIFVRSDHADPRETIRIAAGWTVLGFRTEVVPIVRAGSDTHSPSPQEPERDVAPRPGPHLRAA
jgi:hypothetical protein